MQNQVDSSKDKDPKLKIGDIVKISKYKNISAKDYVSSWCKEIFVIKKFKNTVLWAYVITDLKREETVGTFCEQKTN